MGLKKVTYYRKYIKKGDPNSPIYYETIEVYYPTGEFWNGEVDNEGKPKIKVYTEADAKRMEQEIDKKLTKDKFKKAKTDKEIMIAQANPLPIQPEPAPQPLPKLEDFEVIE